MHLLLVSATDFEISKPIVWPDSNSLPNNASKPELLISGIGQLQTAYSLQKKIQVFRPALVLQAGIGGSPSASDLGKVFVIRSELLADLGMMEKSGFRSLSEMGLDQPDRFPFRQGKLINPYTQLLEWTGLPARDGLTVNEIKSSDTPGFQLNPKQIVESMEGAALHYVCLMEKIPFLQIRSVSNVLGDRDKSRWKLKEAMENLHETLTLLIQKLQFENETLFRI